MKKIRCTTGNQEQQVIPDSSQSQKAEIIKTWSNSTSTAVLRGRDVFYCRYPACLNQVIASVIVSSNGLQT